MPIELVVFDMAGTTVRDAGEVNRCFREALAAVGVTVDAAAVNAVMGLPKPEAIRRLVAASPLAERLADRVAAIHADFVERMCRYYRIDPDVREIPGATATFAHLRQAGVRVGLNTGFSRDIAQLIIERLGWGGERPVIDASVTSDEVPRGRPHPDMIHRLMEQCGVSDAARVAKVGDAPADLVEGSGAGCGLVVGVTSGSHTREELARYPHTHIIASVVDLPSLLSAEL
jgi:phosphonatase-like hydrolase